MLFKRLPSLFGSSVGGLRAFGNKDFVDLDVTVDFQWFKMTGQVSVRELQGTAQGIVIYPLIADKQCHDAEPVAVVEGRIELSEEIFQEGEK